MLVCMYLPEVPEVAFVGRQSGQRREDLLKDKLPVFLIAREHLRKSRGTNTTIKINIMQATQR